MEYVKTLSELLQSVMTNALLKQGSTREISDSHSSKYEDDSLLGYCAMESHTVSWVAQLV
jgi:hypothetical protein